MKKRAVPCPPISGVCAETFVKSSSGVEFSTHSIVTVEENKKLYRAHNKWNECIAKIAIDGGILAHSKTAKADFMLLRCEYNIVYIVELKGSDIKRACEQILATIDNFSDALNKYTVHARIVCGRMPAPDLRTTQKMKLDTYCKAKKGSLRIKINHMEEDF